MKYSEISDSFAPSYPFKMGDPGQFLGNRVADETLQMNLQGGGYYLDSDLVQYMELDEFLDECDLSFDQQNQAGVSELNIEDFLDNKNDQAFEIQQNQDQAARSPKDLLVREAQLNSEQNQNKRRRSSAASTSNSSSSSNNSTSSLTTASIKTDFGGMVINSSGITLNNTQFQGVRVQQIQGTIQPTQFVTVQQPPSQNILPPVPLQNNKKQQQLLQNSQAPQSRIVQPGTSVAVPTTKQPRKTKNSRQKKQTQQPQPIQQPLLELDPVRSQGSGPATLNRSLSATNPSAVVPRETVQRSLSFSVANPQNPRGSKIGAALIVNSNPTTPQTPETPGSPRDIDLDDNSFAVPESPASTAGGSKGKRKRKQSISDNLKDDKYWERRRKNNAAAKRSREERLQKEAEVARQANGLHAENAELKRSLQEALDDNQQLKARLAKYEKI